MIINRCDKKGQLFFFDRGIPDLYGYAKTFCHQEHQPVNDAVEQYRYCQTAFLFPPWEEIYTNRLLA